VLNYEYRWVIGIAFWAATLIRLHEVLIRSISSRLRDATRQRLSARHLSRPVFFPRLSGALSRCTTTARGTACIPCIGESLWRRSVGAMVGLVTLLVALVLGLLVFTAFSVFTTQGDEADSLDPIGR
jgi:hypothetical protein